MRLMWISGETHRGFASKSAKQSAKQSFASRLDDEEDASHPAAQRAVRRKDGVHERLGFPQATTPPQGNAHQDALLEVY